ncbi:MAG TPA: HAMP domain-containing sensor histidine kinase, partial [Myxococcota bacterium]|nr:HAMP domain-containing sensor histidine kinase [Myxococcota bacterium]
IVEWVGIIVDVHDRKRHDESSSFINRASELLSATLASQEAMRSLARLCVPALGDACAIELGDERVVVEPPGAELPAGAVVAPMIARGRTLGQLVLAARDPDVALIHELARRAATAIDNARLFRDAERARREAEAARQRSQFLSRASDVLASAVSFQQVLDEAAALALPDLGDCCIIDFNERDSGRPFGLSHVDPAVGEALKAQVCADRSVLTPLSPPPALPHAGDYAAGALSPAASALMALLRPRALLSLPLLVRDGRWGMVTFVRSGPAAAYSSEETELGEELLRRVAGAIDRAWLIDELQKAVKVRDEFLSIASHELRTPLTALELQLGNLTRLMAKPDPLVWRERFSDKLERATRQTGRLAKLIDNLLDVSRISAGRFRLEPEPMDLARLCQDLGERWSDEAGVAGCRLELDIVGPCEGQWDPLRLEQVITNLLSNAVKYGAGQPIELSLRQDPSGVRMQVRDHGIGVAQGALARIFDRFERAVSPREFGGLGLGLFITREIVEAHGGQISVQSTLGEGATFIVRLPWASEATHHDGGMEGLLPFG